MATATKFPPQKQEVQPGLEHKMHPQPCYASDSYKPGNKLEGKVALVTGGDSGIGRAVAYYYALEGASVAITYVSPQEDKDAKDSMNALNAVKRSTAKVPLAFPANLGDDRNCKEVIDRVIQHFGKIDILVNNAAEQYGQGAIEDITPQEWDKTFHTNIYSYFYLTKHALPHMKQGSCIINTSSVNAYAGNPLLPYTSTKGAIVAFTRSLALQLVQRGIRVNGVAPGAVWTPLIPVSFPEDEVKKFGTFCPMNRAAQPCEIAPSYVFLACDDSSYFTGQFLHPNGGMIVNA